MPTGNRSTYLLSPREMLLRPIELGSVLKWQASPPAPTARPPSGGTQVQVRAFDMLEKWTGKKMPRVIERLSPDHAYVEYDDGKEQIIARGGPSAKKGAFFGDAVNGRLRTVGEVGPAARSVDNRQGTKILETSFVPGRSARQAAEPAKRYADGVNRGQNLYGATTNSNSFANGAYESSVGRRTAAPETWGNSTRLGDGMLPADLQRSRKRLGQGLGSTSIGRAINRVAEDIGSRLDGVPYMPGY